jgi:phosphate-selective porin OprO/OprP
MKKKIAAIGLLAIALTSQSASAKSLEDVLKEKGVITEEDYKEVTKSKPFDYKLGKGFTFTTADEKFQLTLGGRMQFRYTFIDNDGATRRDTSQWDAQRIRLSAQGYAYSKDLTYKLEFDPRELAKSPSSKGLVDAWLNYSLIDEAQIKVGQYKTPFSRQELTSDGALQFVERSPVVTNMKPSYDIGAMLNGKIANGLAYYYAGVFEGAGQSSVRNPNNNNNMFVARAVVNPLGDMPYDEPDFDKTAKPLLSIGANYFRNTVVKTAAALDIATFNYAAGAGWLGSNSGKGFNKAGFAAANDRLDVDSYGADLAFKWMGLSLQGEYILGQAEAQSNGNLLRAQGFYAQAGYMILPKTLEVAFRYSYFDPDRDVVNNNVTEQIGAVSYYFNKHNLKVQADVGNIHTQGNQTVAGVSKPTDDMQYRVQAQIIF